MIITTAIAIALGLVILAMVLTFFRMLRGPDTPDRILALDTLYVNAVALIILFGIWLNSTINFEAALLIAVLGFIGTVALSKYLLRGDIVE